MAAKQAVMFVCWVFFIFMETELKQRALTAVAGVAGPSVGTALNGSKQCSAAYLFFLLFILVKLGFSLLLLI